MGSPVFVASGAVQRFGPGDGVINLAVPAVVANDGLFLFWMEGYGPSSSGATPGTGWGSPIATVAVGAFNRGFRVYYRLAGGSEPATYPVQQTASTSEADQAFIAAWHDPDGGPVSVDAIAASASGTSPTPPLNSVTATVANTTLVGWITGAQTFTAPSGMTVRFNRTTTAQMNLCDLAVASAGATGAKNWTCTNTDYTSIGFALKGLVSGPTLTGATGAGAALTGSGTVSTTGANGSLWWKADASATASDPGVGNEAAGGWTSQAVTASGVQTVASFGALTAGTRYAHYLHVDGAGLRSAVADSAGFTVTAPTSSLTLASTMDVFSSAMALSQAPGVINFPVPKNGSASTWTRSDLTAFVNDRTTNALVCTVTGVSCGPSGGTVSHVSIVSGGLYRLTLVIPPGGALPNGAEGTGRVSGA